MGVSYRRLGLGESIPSCALTQHKTIFISAGEKGKCHAKMAEGRRMAQVREKERRKMEKTIFFSRKK